MDPRSKSVHVQFRPNQSKMDELDSKFVRPRPHTLRVWTVDKLSCTISTSPDDSPGGVSNRLNSAWVLHS